MQLADFFADHPVFTREELEKYVRKHRSSSAGTLEQLIHYHLNQGNIGKVKRGLFYTVGRGFTPEDCPVDLMLVTGKMREDAILAYHTALDLYGQSHSIYNDYYYLTNQPSHTRPVEFREARIKPVKMPKALQQNHNERLEVEPYDRKGLTIDVTSYERTLVDVLDRPDLSGGWEEIWRSTTGFGFLKMEELIEYTLALDNATTVAKVGFYLEEHKETYNVEEKHLKELEAHRPRQPRYMDRSYNDGTMVSRWNLIVPAYVLHEQWEEF